MIENNLPIDKPEEIFENIAFSQPQDGPVIDDCPELSSSKTPHKQVSRSIKPLKGIYYAQKNVRSSLDTKIVSQSCAFSGTLESNVTEYNTIIQSEDFEALLIDSGRSSQASVVQKEQLPKENPKKPTTSYLAKELNRFKHNFNKAINYESSSSLTNTKSKGIKQSSSNKQHKAHVETLTVSKTSEATVLQHAHSSNSQTSLSKSNTLGNSKSHMSNQQIDLHKKFYIGSTVDKKQRSSQNNKFYESYEVKNVSNSKVNREKAHHKSLNMSCSESSKGFFNEESHKATEVEEREITWGSMEKSQESYSYMLTDNSLMLPSNLMKVLEFIENNKQGLPKDAAAQGGNMKYSAEKLEQKDNQSQQEGAGEDICLQKGNALSVNLTIDTEMQKTEEAEPKKELLSYGSDVSQKSPSRVVPKRKTSFAAKYKLKLKLDNFSESQRQTEDDLIATEGSEGLPSFNLEPEEIEDPDMSFNQQVGQTQEKQYMRAQSQPKKRNLNPAPNMNQSFDLGQPLIMYHHSVNKFRKFRPRTNVSEKKTTTSTIENTRNQTSTIEGKEAENFDPVYLPATSNMKLLLNNRRWTKPDEHSSIKQSVLVDINRVITKNNKIKINQQRPRQKMIIAKAAHLYKCYGEYLQTGDKGLSKVI